MRRFHVHLHVEDLDSSIAFYTRVFDAQPDVVKSDYAKWLRDQPALNFAISQTGSNHGISHLGLQVDSDEDLETIRERVRNAALPSIDQQDAACCYARSDKTWIEDPDGVKWEAFKTHTAIDEYGADVLEVRSSGPDSGERCCA